MRKLWEFEAKGVRWAAVTFEGEPEGAAWLAREDVDADGRVYWNSRFASEYEGGHKRIGLGCHERNDGKVVMSTERYPLGEALQSAAFEIGRLRGRLGGA